MEHIISGTLVGRVRQSKAGREEGRHNVRLSMSPQEPRQMLTDSPYFYLLLRLLLMVAFIIWAVMWTLALEFGQVNAGIAANLPPGVLYHAPQLAVVRRR